ncbi:flavin-containing monooxygenase [Solimonas marina]|uniref:Alpha/beta hydrolase fold domain-containing protein n=1 Tax=Solimonas marina TaxID=2714601 RepID=A0A969W9Q6_9GAMM|nr:alpha/beta hydrolase fold domain-containing protein [Solimonas marina]NKF22105.1 alpha/beta hydrolase fold domain-containing protein [Solimonas marina]
MADSGFHPGGHAPLSVVVIGAGFSGIGMGVALRRAGIEDFVIVERATDVGGVWRDNHYPGAACDVPSHLYSFSFEPKADWTHVFARQPEIADYLRHCADKYGLLPHIRFGTAVRGAQYDEATQLWTVRLADGHQLVTRLLVSGVGQLSRPALPSIPGIEDFQGHSFHSADWDTRYELAGKRVAVIGTGASAIQFVPAIAPQVASLTVFQRSPAWMMKRPDRPYRAIEKRAFAEIPALAKLHRLGIYLKYESRALAFTRFKSLMKPAVALPFHRLLRRQVQDPALRRKLTPDYPIGCKRILLSSDYLAAIARPNVELVIDGIRRVTATGVEAVDGRHHQVDAIIYGTGFAATEFLAPMTITGRAGVDLNAAWRDGAAAYLGMAVPGFPNFFMLYGPNTNLGHNSIVYMLESQIAHVMRCIAQMRDSGAATVEVKPERHTRYNARVQQRLGATVWNGCKSWYVDANGHNSTNWPGFTFSYRWITAHRSLQAYRFEAPDADAAGYSTRVLALQAMRERASAALLRGILRTSFRPLIGPPFPAPIQRAWVEALSTTMPGKAGTHRQRIRIADRPVEILRAPRERPSTALLYLHGGAFCLGSPRTHRSISTHLAHASGMAVWVPDYRLAPEHPYPAALDDALACFNAMLVHGYRPEQIAIAGDSAGGALALELALRLRELGKTPAALAVISPVTDPSLSGDTVRDNAAIDPMLRRGWVEQGLRWYGGADTPLLERDLSGLPPTLIQVGEQEILLSDATRFAQRAVAQGVDLRLERHEARWHVFHLQSFYLQTAVDALQTMAAFCRAQTAAPDAVPAAHRRPQAATP